MPRSCAEVKPESKAIGAAGELEAGCRCRTCRLKPTGSDCNGRQVTFAKLSWQSDNEVDKTI